MTALRQRFSPVTAVFLIVLVDVLGFTIILPLLPFYAERYGASPFTIGCLIASYAACQLVSGPFLGRLSDTMGRKPLLLVSQAGTCLGFLIVAFAPNMAWIFVGRILDGMTAGNISLAQAAISDVTAPSERGKAFSKVGIAFGIGFLIGPALAGFLARYGYEVPILAGAGLSATSIVATLVLLPKQETIRKAAPGTARRQMKIFDWSQFKSFFARPELRLRLIQFFALIMTFSMYMSGIALFAGHRLTLAGHPFGPTEVAYLLAYGGLMGICMQGLLLGRLIKRFGERRLTTWGFMALMIGCGVLSTATGLVVALVAGTFITLGHSLLRPTLTSLVSQEADARSQGAVLGVSQSLQSVAQVLAPLVGGWLIDWHYESTWALVACAVASLGFLAPRVSARAVVSNRQ